MDAARYVRLLLICLVVGLGIQIARPSRTNPPVDPGQTIAAHVAIPPAVQSTLRRACYDCHSNETRWPWYSGVAPVSWFVIGHVNDARQVLNFSDWSAHGRRATAPPLARICQQVQSKRMPLSSYLWLHDDAHLSTEDVTDLCAWAAQAMRGPDGSAGR